MPLTEDQLVSLANDVPITDAWPWNTRDDRVVHKHVENVINDLCSEHCLKEVTEFNHYGSGYASFVDCFLYRDEKLFRIGVGQKYTGLFVLISRLSHYFVLGEGEKSCGIHQASFYLPSLGMMDHFNNLAVAKLAHEVTRFLEARGCVRAYADELSAEIPKDIEIPTILNDGPLRQFDALFYWED